MTDTMRTPPTPPESGSQLMSGQDLLERGDANAVKLVYQRLLLRAAEAREDLVAFFEFVMREEKGLRRVKCAPHQKVLLKFLHDHDRPVIMLPVGHAKCHGRGTSILMADGDVRSVEDVRVGERVMGPDGPKRVTHTSHGRQVMYRVVPVKGSEPFTVNEEHVLTLVHTETGEVVDIALRDYLARSEWFQSQHKLFRVGVERFEEEERIQMDPYFLGVWFGDGLHSVRHGVRLTSMDPEVREHCREVAGSYDLDLVEKQKYDFALVKRGGKRSAKDLPRGTPNPLMRAIREHVGEGLSMECVRRAPRDQKLQFLAGFIDADGCVRDNCVYITQKRSDWVDVIVFVARSLGIAVTRGTEEHPRHGTYHRVCLYGGVDQIPTKLPRRALRPRSQKKDPMRTGFRVEPLGEGEYFGFTVGGDGRYLLGDFTVTHNTFCLVAYTLWSLGRNPSLRGAIVSATQGQAEKVVTMVRDYIQSSPELKMVFPDLKQSSRPGDSWTQTRLVVERQPGIRDASLVAHGIDSQTILGSRLNWVIVDDLLNAENTRTPESREKVKQWVDSSVRSRLDPMGQKLAFSNTPWHPQDLVMQLKQAGWPTLRMDVEGYVYVQDDVMRREEADQEGREFTPWDCDDLRPAYPLANLTDAMFDACRLVAHDPDPDHETTLWPERMNRAQMEASKRSAGSMQAWLQSNLCVCVDPNTMACKPEWVEGCKRLAQKVGHHSMQSAYSEKYINRIVANLTPKGEMVRIAGPWQVFIGVDLAFSKSDRSDDTAFFTFVPLPSGHRLILEIEIGKWTTPDIIQKCIDKAVGYNDAIVTVENNGGQRTIRDVALQRNAGLRIKAFTTGKNKADPTYGVQSIFPEIENGAWLIPTDRFGAVHPMVQKWIDGMIYYVPDKHTSDSLMAMFFAREQARKLGMLSGGATSGIGGAPDLDFTCR